MNFIAYFSVPCMVSEEEQDYEHEQNVVEKAHMNGIMYALISSQGDLIFGDLVSRESSDTWATSVIKGLVRDTIIKLVL
jgi:hypothetical protein